LSLIGTDNGATTASFKHLKDSVSSMDSVKLGDNAAPPAILDDPRQNFELQSASVFPSERGRASVRIAHSFHSPNSQFHFSQLPDEI
jgi:hypothetical protein